MKKEIKIGSKVLSSTSPYIIAEMSANHLMDLERAKAIILAARESGADAIKLQTYRPDTITLDVHNEEFLCTPGSPWEGMNLFDLYKTAYTPWEWHEELFNYAKEIGIDCFSTPFDLTAVDFLSQFDMPAVKIASFEINDIPLIEKAAKLGKPIIISTGIAEIEDINLAIETCHKAGNDQIVLLKCISSYPAPYSEFNLKTIPDMEDKFDCVIGISDHSMGSIIPISAVTLGATVIEKHMTLKRADGGPDGSFSMEPQEFKAMVDDVHNICQALGEVTYELTDKQKNARPRSRSLYVSADIKAGESFSESNIKSVRPGYGLHTKYYYDILGKKAKCDLKMGTALKWDYIE